MLILVILLQNVLRELEQKKPQLDELVHTAENLKAEPNRQQLHGKGKLKMNSLFTNRPSAIKVWVRWETNLVFHRRKPRINDVNW